MSKQPSPRDYLIVSHYVFDLYLENQKGFMGCGESEVASKMAALNWVVGMRQTIVQSIANAQLVFTPRDVEAIVDATIRDIKSDYILSYQLNA